jgi:hypothetical protein
VVTSFAERNIAIFSTDIDSRDFTMHKPLPSAAATVRFGIFPTKKIGTLPMQEAAMGQLGRLGDATGSPLPLRPCA